MEKNFIRVRSAKDLIKSSLLVILGCTLIVVPAAEPVSITGFFLFIAGLITLFILKTAYKDAETGIKYRKSERFFAQDMRESIKSALTSPTVIDPASEDKGNGLRLDIYYSHSADKAFAQLNEYVPYKYEPCSRYYEFNMDDASKLLGK